MISIIDKHKCCGCSACFQRCPQNCITMEEDAEGFLYPHVNENQCTHCGVCENVCPCINQKENPSEKKTIVSTHPNEEIRRASSSGGIFSLLAEYVISKNGVVFGARFDRDWNVKHDFTDSTEGLCAFRGSKYVQSIIGKTFQQTEYFLKDGRMVLFSGTPCQINGLKLFLRKDYINLLTVAIACHSVPSPKVWREYLKGLKLDGISNINFRDKKISWERYGLSIQYNGKKIFFQEHDYNPYMQLFLHGISIRPICFNCPAKGSNNNSDIILGDSWGITNYLPVFNNCNKGVNFVILQTKKAIDILNILDCEKITISYKQIEHHNGGVRKTIKQPQEYVTFWEHFLNNNDKNRIIQLFSKPYQPHVTLRAKLFLYKIFGILINKILSFKVDK